MSTLLAEYASAAAANEETATRTAPQEQPDQQTLPHRGLPPQPQPTGIDIRKALDILASRPPHQHNESDYVHHSHGVHATAMGCCQGPRTKLPLDDYKRMGQTIDLLEAPSSSSPPTPSVDSSDRGVSKTPASEAASSIPQQQHQQHQQQPMQQHLDEPKQSATLRQEELRQSLRVLSTPDLIQVILRAQEDRVRTYRRYEQALEQVLATGNLTLYPPACATATASFAVLSETIKAVRAEFLEGAAAKANNRRNCSNTALYTQWIQELQQSEQEKLQLTAACHLEMIRAKNQEDEIRYGSSGTSCSGSHTNGEATYDESSGNDGRILKLLQEGVASFQGKIGKCMERINLILDDFRCALVEEMEEQEQELEND